MKVSHGEYRGACPVCRQAELEPFREVSAIRYHRCCYCQATVMDPQCRLDPVAEKTEYELHENDPEDAGYRAFMRRLTDPLLPHLPPGAQGLDYGCGSGSPLAGLLQEQGYEIALYDPIFRPDRSVLERQYDFLTCTETAEHFFHPFQEFQRLDGLLRPGGILAVMTCFLTDDSRFDHWHYRRDPTHVVFYQPRTMQVLAELFGWHCEIPETNVTLFRKPT